MMAQFVKIKEPISLTKCIDTKWDNNTSWFLTELKEHTESHNIIWVRDYRTPNVDVQYKVFGTYTNANGMKIILELDETIMDGIELKCTYVNNNKKVIKNFNEWYYPDELQDLLTAIQTNRSDYESNSYIDDCDKSKGYMKPKLYDNISKLVNPYYDKKTEELPVKKILNTRGRKAIKLLENVEWEHNCQVLGE